MGKTPLIALILGAVVVAIMSMVAIRFGGGTAPAGAATTGEPAFVLESGEVRTPEDIGPAVIFIASAGCAHCHNLLARMAQVQAQEGRAGADRFYLFVLEGAEAGGVMKAQNPLTGMHVVSSTIDGMRHGQSMGIRAVPTLIELDETGIERARVTGDLRGADLFTWMEKSGMVR